MVSQGCFIYRKESAMNTKKCTRCGEVKSPEDFVKDKRNADGLGAHCRVCQGKMKKAWKEKQEKVVGPREAKILEALAAGEKKCTKCGVVKPLSEYHADKRSSDGHYSHCRDCHYQATRAYEQTDRGKEVVSKSKREWYYERGGREYDRIKNASEEARLKRAEYLQTEAGKEAQKRKDAKRRELYPERLRAKLAVRDAIAKGILPPVNTLPCAECKDGTPALEYHHSSYEREDWLKVVPLCKKHHAATYTNPHE